ncbi:MAG: ATP-dependent helicase [Schleiferilactobacillus harbinensis]|jgi:superfamily I DNA/RNA helicase|nr:ATP-dependent helicase [Schleiferilactobacillus harbinensis]
MLIDEKGMWKPSSNIILEENASMVVKSQENFLVIAGPGSGKTELLAQRANFLLQMGYCADPFNILAISFKRDAASNLLDRVRARLEDDSGRRFVSLTYDAFAKKLLDQFRNSLPEKFRPQKHYEIGDGPNQLSFGVICQLATRLVTKNSKIRDAIQAAFPFAFLDEFQDTTDLQYNLVKSCFLGSRTCITAVGDDKQRIMGWAGAKKGIFQDFQRDFSSAKTILRMNHRSAPRLVDLQEKMYDSLNTDKISVLTSNRWDKDDGEIILFDCENENDEAIKVGTDILVKINSGIPPKDIAILVKQQPERYVMHIIDWLAQRNVKARIENPYQDLLKEPIVNLIISTIHASLNLISAPEWQHYFSQFLYIRGIDIDLGGQAISEARLELDDFLFHLRPALLSAKDNSALTKLVQGIVNFFGKKPIMSMFSQYQQSGFMEGQLDVFTTLLSKNLSQSRNLTEAVDRFLGVHSIPIMTIHKSKGLEYQAVYFIGLEDEAFWSFSRQPQESRSVFFVAISRAKQYLAFSFCKVRRTPQHHYVINEFYELLQQPGVAKVIGH